MKSLPRQRSGAAPRAPRESWVGLLAPHQRTAWLFFALARM